MSDYSGKVALITGAANGIGIGIAEQCAKEGMKLVLADIDQSALDVAGKDLAASGAQVIWQKTDVSRDKDWSQLVDKTIKEYGKIDFLFSNAGISFNKALASATEAEWKWIFDVNFRSHLIAINKVLPIMQGQESGGHIAVTGSFASFVAPATMVPYACTKSALLSLMEGLRSELDMVRQTKIKLSVIMPAYVVTNIQHNDNARPEECRQLEDTSNDIDKFVWSKIADDIKEPSIYNGAISKELAGERILDQI